MEPYDIANNIELEVVALEVIDTTLRFMLDENVSYKGIMPTEIIDSLSQSIGKLNNYLGELYMLCNLRFPKEEKPKRCKEFSVKDQEWIESCINEPDKYVMNIVSDIVAVTDTETGNDIFKFGSGKEDFISQLLLYIGCETADRILQA